MTATRADYWKVKAALLELTTRNLEARLAACEARAKFAEAMHAAGLDPALDYELQDADESITLKVRM